MATDRRAWTTERTWTIKGVSDRTRDAVVERAHDAGLTIGEWVDQALARAAEEARNPRPPAVTREDVAAVVREELAPLLERLAAPETKLSRKTRPAPRPEPVPPAPVGAREGDEPEARGRRLPEHVRERIAELHRAGRSVYAISKELGVSYNAVRARHGSRPGKRAEYLRIGRLTRYRREEDPGRPPNLTGLGAGKRHHPTGSSRSATTRPSRTAQANQRGIGARGPLPASTCPRTWKRPG